MGVIPPRVMNSLNSLNFTTKTRDLYSKSGKEISNFYSRLSKVN